MKKIFLSIVGLLLVQLAHSQITQNGASGSSMTTYTNGAPNDPIYIWCNNTLSAATGSLTATPTSGVGPFTFNWFFHNQANSSWTSLTSESGSTSTISSLASDGYRVEITDAGNNLVDCFVAWVWNLNTEVTASNTRVGCSQANLSSTVNTTGTFSYYNPPPPQSLINPLTDVQVCFSADHTFVSDLAFYLIGPASCGSPVINLCPNPAVVSQPPTCNGGNNITNLCFSTTSVANMNVCTASAPLSGTYGTYGPGSVAPNWSSLVGCNATSGGWRVQIFDCIAEDVGALTNASINFSNLTSKCGSPTFVNYTSGAIESDIDDMACDPVSASIFQVPVATNLTTAITINATTTHLWTSTSGITAPTSLNTNAPGLPEGTTAFTKTATTTFGSVSCTASANTSFTYTMPVVDAGAPSTVCAGQPVTLSGSGANTYTWNNGASNGVSFAPAATQTYTVTGTDANGCQNTDQVLVTVNLLPSVNAGADRAVCTGANTILAGTGAAGYTWNNGASNGVSFAPAATQTYTVTGTDGNGCVNTDQVIVTVNPLPVVNAGADRALCMGAATILNGTGATTYAWNNSASNGVSFAPTTTQTYTVTGTDANGCISTDQVIVTVNPLPVVNAGADRALCIGASTILAGTGATTYNWNNGASNGVSFVPAATQTYTVTGTDGNGCINTDMVVVTVNPLPPVNGGIDRAVCIGGTTILSGTGATSYTWNNSVTNGTSFSPAATQTYTVTGTDANGCVNTDQVIVTVNPLPIVNAGADRAVCAGVSTTLIGSGASTYVWNNGATNNVSFVPASTQTYTVTGTNVNGCVNTDQVLVTVNPLPAVNAGADRAVCIGATATLTATGATNYSWNGGVTNGVTFTPAATTTYTVTGTDGNNCQNTDAVTITVNPLPIVTAGINDTICDGESAVLSGSGASTYTWTNGVVNGVPFSPSGTQTYTVTGTNSNGCISTASVQVTVVPVPIAVISVNGGLQGNPGFVASFDNASSFATSYSWNFGNGQTDVTTDITDGYDIVYSNLGMYTVTLVADNGFCTSTDTKNVIIVYHPVVIVNVPNVVTPNGDGTNDLFNIDVENVASLKVQIVNRWGENVREFDGLTTGWDAKTEKGDEVTAGIYFFTYDIVGLDGTEMSGQGFVHVVR